MLPVGNCNCPQVSRTEPIGRSIRLHLVPRPTLSLLDCDRSCTRPLSPMEQLSSSPVLEPPRRRRQALVETDANSWWYMHPDDDDLDLYGPACESAPSLSNPVPSPPVPPAPPAIPPPAPLTSRRVLQLRRSSARAPPPAKLSSGRRSYVNVKAICGEDPPIEDDTKACPICAEAFKLQPLK